MDGVVNDLSFQKYIEMCLDDKLNFNHHIK